MAKQKRSSNTYQKINTVFKRDERGIILPNELYLSEMEYLRDCRFDCEEKVDGTNIRIEVFPILSEDDTFLTWEVRYKGKTDNAEIPRHLLSFLTETYPKDRVLYALSLQEGDVSDVDRWSDGSVFVGVPRYTLYGEGYGYKIQSCGSRYLKDRVSFVGFDVNVDDMYLLKDNRDDIFERMGCPVVPYIGSFTLSEAIEYVKEGHVSMLSEDIEMEMEGLVCRTPHGLLTRQGERIIYKVKAKDFRQYAQSQV